jgi:hypothetical protein
MSFFGNNPEDWERLDWQILRDGAIHLYWRSEYLAEDERWFADHGYRLYRFDCSTWTSSDEMFADFGRVLEFPDWWGRNINALDECMADLAIGTGAGAALLLSNFDIYFFGSGAATLMSGRIEAEVVLDIISRASQFQLLNGRRLVALIQTKDPKLHIGKLGGMAPCWNRREWLDAKRESK